jgi:hypothetical protein
MPTFEHNCHCGAWGAWTYDRGETWYCAQHRPREQDYGGQARTQGSPDQTTQGGAHRDDSAQRAESETVARQGQGEGDRRVRDQHQSEQATMITLTDEHDKFCQEIAKLRRSRGIQQDRPARPGHTIIRPTFEYELLGVRAECAAYLWVNDPSHELAHIVWHAKAERGPDLGEFIDVKGVAEAHYSLPVQDGQPENAAYVLVLGHAHPQYTLVGWKWGYECKNARVIDPYGGAPFHVVPQDELRPLAELIAELRKREDGEV